MVGVVWGEVTPHFPLYIVEALLVEAVFLRAGGRSPVVNGAIAGALIGTIGLAAEWAWTHVWMPIPWNDSLLPEAAIAGLITAVAAGVVGGFIGGSLVGRSGALISREDGARLTSGDRRAALAGGLVLMAVIGWALPMSYDGPGARPGRAEGHPEREPAHGRGDDQGGPAAAPRRIRSS